MTIDHDSIIGTYNIKNNEFGSETMVLKKNRHFRNSEESENNIFVVDFDLIRKREK